MRRSQIPKMPEGEGYIYFKVVDAKYDFLGERWFRYMHSEDQVVELCHLPGEAAHRGGRNRCVGIYTIGRLSFMSNYFAMSYVEQVTKEQYMQMFDHLVTVLR